MNASTMYRRAPGLLAGVALLLICVLFSGCRLSSVYAPSLMTDLFGEHQDQFPAVVLSLDNNKPSQTVDYTFDWNETTLGGAKVRDFKISSGFWRMRIFNFSDGTPIGSYTKFKSIEKDPAQTFAQLPVEKLLRVDLDLADNEEGTENRRTYSVTVLFHYEK